MAARTQPARARMWLDELNAWVDFGGTSYVLSSDLSGAAVFLDPGTRGTWGTSQRVN